MLPQAWEYAGELRNRQAFWEYSLEGEPLVFDLREVFHLSAATLVSLVPLAKRRAVTIWADPIGQPAQALCRWFGERLADEGQREDNGAWQFVLDLTPEPVTIRRCQPGDPVPPPGYTCENCPLRDGRDA